MTIGATAASRGTDEISATTPVARALLGHGVGETVTVTAVRSSRWTITAVVPAAVPTPTAPAARPLPDAEVGVFGPWQDRDYAPDR